MLLCLCRSLPYSTMGKSGLNENRKIRFPDPVNGAHRLLPFLLSPRFTSVSACSFFLRNCSPSVAHGKTPVSFIQSNWFLSSVGGRSVDEYRDDEARDDQLIDLFIVWNGTFDFDLGWNRALEWETGLIKVFYNNGRSQPAFRFIG